MIGNLTVEDLLKLKEKLSKEQWRLIEEQIRNYILGRWNDGTAKKVN